MVVGPEPAVKVCVAFGAGGVDRAGDPAGDQGTDNYSACGWCTAGRARGGCGAGRAPGGQHVQSGLVRRPVVVITRSTRMPCAASKTTAAPAWYARAFDV